MITLEKKSLIEVTINSNSSRVTQKHQVMDHEKNVLNSRFTENKIS